MDSMSPGDRDLVDLVSRVAGVDPQLTTAERVESDGLRLLTETIAAGIELGVAGVPTLYRHGPVMLVRTTPAVVMGNAIDRLSLIDAVLDDDGIWALSKP